MARVGAGDPRATGAPAEVGKGRGPLRRLLAQALRKAAIATVTLVLAAAVLFVAVSEPLDRSPILGTDVARRTELGIVLAARRLAERGLERGPLRAGFAAREMTPPLGTPTFGYGARLGKGTEAIADPLFVRALALAAGDGPPLVLVSADLCLWPRPLSEAVAEAVRPLVARERLYVGATHTHNGPGAIARGPLLEWMFGRYDPAVAERIVLAARDAIAGALADLAPATYREDAFPAPDLVENRMHGDDAVDDEVYALAVERADGRRYALAVFAAHATAIDHSLCVTSGDWPGALARELAGRGFDGAVVLAGPTGQAGPRVFGKTAYHASTDAAYRLGAVLAERVADALATAASAPQSEVALGNLYAEVALPRWRFRRFGRMVGPYYAGLLIDTPEPSAHVHAVRIGHTVLVGHSFEMSAVLSRRLKDEARARGARLVITSFNGEHGFYVVPDADYEDGLYEAGMTFFGPGLGSYLAWVTERAVDGVWAAGQVAPPGSASASAPIVPRSIAPPPPAAGPPR